VSVLNKLQFYKFKGRRFVIFVALSYRKLRWQLHLHFMSFVLTILNAILFTVIKPFFLLHRVLDVEFLLLSISYLS